MTSSKDEYDVFFIREVARHRDKLQGQRALWRLERWAKDPLEGHHLARKRYGEVVVDVPVSMHRELTRRQLEEHPPDNDGPITKPVRLGRLLVGAADVFQALVDALWIVGETLIESGRALDESDLRLQGLRRILPAVEKTLEIAAAAIKGTAET